MTENNNDNNDKSAYNCYVCGVRLTKAEVEQNKKFKGRLIFYHCNTCFKSHGL
jgi:hypothetical protein